MHHTKDFGQIPRIWVWLRFPSWTHLLWITMALRRGRGSKARFEQSFARHSYLRRFSHKGPFSQVELHHFRALLQGVTSVGICVSASGRKYTEDKIRINIR